jgi:hypothetical protein
VIVFEFFVVSEWVFQGTKYSIIGESSAADTGFTLGWGGKIGSALRAWNDAKIAANVVASHSNNLHNAVPTCGLRKRVNFTTAIIFLPSV